MKRTIEEITRSFSEFAGDRVTEDAAINLMEDIADSMVTDSSDMEHRYSDLETRYNDLESRYNDLDRTWREKYTKRFYDAGEDAKPEKIEEAETGKDAEEITIKDLFKED